MRGRGGGRGGREEGNRRTRRQTNDTSADWAKTEMDDRRERAAVGTTVTNLVPLTTSEPHRT